MYIKVWLLMITAIIKVILICIGKIKTEKLKKIRIDIESRGISKLFGHEIKSFIDTFNSISKYSIYSEAGIVVFVLLVFTNQKLQKIIPGTYIGYIILFLFIVIYILVFTVGMMSIYAISEIKHLSPKDAIYKEAIEGRRHYLETRLYGLINLFTALAEVYFLFNKIGVIVYLLLLLIVFILGMGDLLQTDNYNIDISGIKGYSNQLKVFTKVLRAMVVKADRKKTNRIIRENINNIYIGIKREGIFRL